MPATKEMHGAEVGDLVVVKTAFTTRRGWQFLPDDVGILTKVLENGSINLTADKHETNINIHQSFLVNCRLVPKGLRSQFRKEHGSGYIKQFDKVEHGVTHIVEEMARVDDILNNAMVFFDKVLETGRELSAIESVWALRENLRTYVLATVMAPGWHSSWASGIPPLVTSHSRFCSNLTMAAVKGGEACDKEIAFIEALMPRMGFTVEKAAQKSQNEDVVYHIAWRWKRPRQGADDYIVNLIQYQNVEFADMLAQQMAPEPKHCQKPNLKRVAVVSAPVDDKAGQPINERLNVLLLRMLDGAANRAATKGFLPVPITDWRKSEENNRIYQEYFDLPIRTLASMGFRRST